MSDSLLSKIHSPDDLKILDVDGLRDLSSEIRKRIIEVLSVTGGHLSSNLGVVELTITLHYLLDSPKDKIVWDVGHQSYAHKLLSDRKDSFDTLRTYKGISGFAKIARAIPTRCL